jgi:hypothetical protein
MNAFSSKLEFAVNDAGRAALFADRTPALAAAHPDV